MLKDNKTLFIEGYDPNKNIMRKLSVCKSSVKKLGREYSPIKRTKGRTIMAYEYYLLQLIPSFRLERSFSDHLFADLLSGPGEDFPNEFDIPFRRIFIVEQTVTECVIDLFESELSGFACEFLIIISGEIAFFSVA